MRRSGYTLIELAAVVLILGLLAAVAIPQLSSGDPARLDLAAGLFAEAIRHARDEAIRTGNGAENEDPLDGIDNDGDGAVDEDAASDTNGDGCDGVCGVDDDGDGWVDESTPDDDDEDGGERDDPYNPLVFYLDHGTLMERIPVPWNEDGNSAPDGPVDGRDFIASALAEQVTHFRVQRLPGSGGPDTLVDLTLELTSPTTGETVTLNTRVRVGGGQ